MPQLDGRVEDRRIIGRVRIRPPLAGADMSGLDVHALIDTGATASAITRRVIHALSLPFTGKRPLGSAQGDQQIAWHMFGIGFLPDRGGAPFFFEDQIGFEVRDGFRFDAIVGMDVLSLCDFNLTRDGNWTLAFGR